MEKIKKPIPPLQPPIAIVGMSFRFPGDLSTEEDFWAVLSGGSDMIGKIGPDRWAVEELAHPTRMEPGRSVTFSAGTLSRIKEFDAEFFNISPREAVWLDPQQRLLLEMSWEAMENGGHVPEKMAGSRCAVYVGISSLDYGVAGATDLSSMSSHSMTGNTMGLAANRISYVFDLHGPSIAMDTACSSALVALHHACNALNSGEVPAALVGSVNMLLHPYPFVGFTKASMISANGRCRAFDADADGYVRAEGGAVLLLKTLEQAERDGDKIHAVIMGSGVNSDGGRKSGITIPSAEGQAELMQNVLARAGILPEDVDYVEAHGTGTAVGDPIEAMAIGNVYGCGRKTPLPIGSVKTNVGHLETASGMAGLVKVILMLKKKALAPSINFSSPNQNINFKKMNLRVVRKLTTLSEKKTRRFMGINSFGIGGTNTHILVGDYTARPKPSAKKAAKSALPPLFISAQTPKALAALAGQYAERLAKIEDWDYYDIAASAALHRSFLRERLAVSGATAAEIAAQLKNFSEGAEAIKVVTEKDGADGVTFIYTGNGAVWAGMGLKLLGESKVFTKALKEVDAEIRRQGGFSVLKELQKEGEKARLGEASVAQPLLFALQVAITKMLEDEGVSPAAVMGHSVGEIAAAWAAGALTLKQAVTVILARSTAQEKSHGKGRMAAVGLSAAAVRDVIAAQKCASVEIACINSPSGVTLSGKLQELEKLQAALAPRNVFFRLLDIDYAFHSRFMNAILPDLKKHLGKIAPKKTRIPFISTVTGKELAGTELDSAYWQKNVRRPVQFEVAMETLIASGRCVFVEIGPHAILQRYMKECIAAAGTTGRILPTLQRHDDGAAAVQNAALRLHLLNPADIQKRYFSAGANFVDLPSYPWQRETYWVGRTNECDPVSDRARVHPLLGWRVKHAAAAWENVLDMAQTPWLTDHRILDAAVFPGAGYVEMALAAAREHFGGERFEIDNLEILAPVVFDGAAARSLRFELDPSDGTFRILSRARLSDEDWAVNAAGRLLGAPESSVPVAPPRLRGETTGKEEHYALLAGIGLVYGPAFQALDKVAAEEGSVDGFISLPEALPQGAEESFLLHPSLLDAAAQSVMYFFRAAIEAGKGYPLLPVKVGRVRRFGAGTPARFRIDRQGQIRRTLKADITLVDKDDNVVCVLEDFRFRAAPGQKSAPPPAQWQVTAELVADPHSSAAFADIAGTARRHCAAAGESLDYFKNGRPLMEALTVSFIYEAFKTLQETKAAWLQGALDAPEMLPEDRRAYFNWAVACLKEYDLLAESDGLWELADKDLPPPEDIWREIYADFPQALPELLAAGHIGRHLPEMLSDTATDAASFAVGQSQLAAQLLESAPSYAGVNLALEKTLAGIAADWPQKRRLRILQITNGAGGLPHRLAAKLPAARTDYVVAVADKDDIVRLKNEYKDYGFLSVAALDAETMTPQGADLPRQFDVIILKHWLHTIALPEAALVALRSRQAAGGLVVLAERSPSWQADFIFGPDPNWWHGGAPVSGLRTADEWKDMLEKQGFDEVEDACDEEGGACLLFARAPATEVEVEKKSWMIICDEKQKTPTAARAKNIAKRLKAAGQSVSATATTPANDVDGFDNIVYLSGLGGGSGGDETRCAGALSLVQTLSALENPPRLWLVTAGGAPVAPAADLGAVNPAEAPLWGLGRVIMNEYPALRCTLVDIGADAGEDLCAALLAPNGETEIILRGESRYGVRLARTEEILPAPPVADERFRLDFAMPGNLRNLAFMPAEARELRAGEIEVRPAASGLNFRDVMYAMGLLPDEAVENGFLGANLGLEFAGVVSAAGPEVRDVKVGDRVMGFGPASFASHVVTTEGAVMPVPEGWSFAAAATVPTTFFTAYYALKHLAHVGPGEKVLIHGAAGGVGLAAIQIAHMLGAEIYATAGSAEKRDFLKLLGIEHVFDSRSLAFADDIKAVAPEGVDVVLNALAGEAINRNLNILKPFGRFLELGKRDFYQNTRIGLRPFRNNISYFGIDVDQLMIVHPALSARLFREIAGCFESGDFKPLPYHAYPAHRATDAFRCLQQSRHIGKVVVDFTSSAVTVERDAPEVEPPQFKKNGTYLVTGGIAGFGLETAAWLARHGAGHVVLLGRRGEKTPDVKEAAARIRDAGGTAHIFACDVSDEAQLKNVLAEIKKQGLPALRGVVHAAMVLDDALLENQTPARFAAVFAPKIKGAWNLHSVTRNMKLDCFILYSSVTTAIGNPGQGNYVAANAYLEALTALRRRENLPATCVGWGPIGDAGYLTRNAMMKDGLEARLGARPLTKEQALEKLGAILRAGTAVATVADFSWNTMAAYLPSSDTARFAPLRRTETEEETAGHGDVDFMQMIAGKSPEEVAEMVRAALFAEVGKTLSMSADRIDPARPLTELGMDSLMMVELALAIEKSFGIHLPAMALNGQAVSIDAIGKKILERVSGAATDAGQGMTNLVAMMAAQHNENVTANEILDAPAAKAGAI